MFCFWLERHCLRTIERHCRTVNKGSDSGVGETWCDSLNYCSENTLLPLSRRVVHLPSTLMLGVAVWPTLGRQQMWWSRGLKCASVVGPAPSCFDVHHRKEMTLGAALLSASEPEIHGADLQFAAWSKATQLRIAYQLNHSWPADPWAWKQVLLSLSVGVVCSIAGVDTWVQRLPLLPSSSIILATSCCF